MADADGVFELENHAPFGPEFVHPVIILPGGMGALTMVVRALRHCADICMTYIVDDVIRGYTVYLETSQ